MTTLPAAIATAAFSLTKWTACIQYDTGPLCGDQHVWREREREGGPWRLISVLPQPKQRGAESPSAVAEQLGVGMKQRRERQASGLPEVVTGRV